MEMFINVTVFNPELKGKAVRIEGRDEQGHEWNDICLVKSVNGESILLIDCDGNFYEFDVKSFGNTCGIAKMTLNILKG